MKLFHISDLHIGKRVNGLNVLEDQRYILAQMLEAISQNKPDALLISGDIYDKSVPSAEAVSAFDEFLSQVHGLGVTVFAIGGNHDSIERLSFGHRLMESSGVHIAPVYAGEVKKYTLEDAFGPVNIYPLPFLRPADVRQWFPEIRIESYHDGVKTALEALTLDPGQRNVLLAHQFVTGASLCESEEFNVGGLDNVDSSVFDGFDYVALGHIHGPQNVGAETVRYCGSPLKYSFSEENQEKSITVVTLGSKGQVEISTIPLVPRRDMRTLRGSFAQLTDRDFYSQQATGDYLRIVLTDEEEVPEAIGFLRSIYPNTMLLSYDNARSRSNASLQAAQEVASKSPLELFRELYAQQNNQPMSDTQKNFVQSLIDSIWRDSQ